MVSIMVLLFPYMLILIERVYGNLDCGLGGLSLTLYSNLPWNYDFSVTNVVLVDIMYDPAVFDFCDVTQYTPAGVANLLALHNLTAIDSLDTDDENLVIQQWVAVVTDDNMGYICQSRGHLSFREIYMLYQDQTRALYIQATGASGYVALAPDTSPLDAWRLQLYEDIYRGTINDVKIYIFGGIVIDTMECERLRQVLSANLRQHVPLFVNISNSVNEWDVIQSPKGTFRSLSWINLVFTICCFIYSFHISVLYFRNQRKPNFFAVFALSCILASDVTRILVAIDPSGVFAIFDIILCRVLFTLHVSLSCIGSICSKFVWLDALKTTENAMRLRINVHPWSTNFRLRLLVLIFTVLLMSSDVFMSVVGQYGLLNGTKWQVLPAATFAVLLVLLSLTNILFARKVHYTLQVLASGGADIPGDEGNKYTRKISADAPPVATASDNRSASLEDNTGNSNFRRATGVLSTTQVVPVFIRSNSAATLARNEKSHDNAPQTSVIIKSGNTFASSPMSKMLASRFEKIGVLMTIGGVLFILSVIGSIALGLELDKQYPTALLILYFFEVFLMQLSSILEITAISLTYRNTYL